MCNAIFECTYCGKREGVPLQTPNDMSYYDDIAKELGWHQIGKDWICPKCYQECLEEANDL